MTAADRPTMSKFEPLYDAHAIDQMGIVVQVSQPLEFEQLELAVKASDQFKSESELPVSHPIQSFSVGFAVGGAASPQTPAIRRAGQSLQKLLPDGTPALELRIEPQRIGLIVRRYTRWADIRSLATKYLGGLLGHYISRRTLQSVSLAYTDRFFWDGNSEDAQPSSLLRENAKYLAPHVLHETDLWHSHSGRFVKVDAKIKRLVQVNTDCIDQDLRGVSRRVIAVTTNLADIFGQPGYATLDVPKDAAASFACERLDSLHSESKVMLADVINDQMCKRIGLMESL